MFNTERISTTLCLVLGAVLLSGCLGPYKQVKLDPSSEASAGNSVADSLDPFETEDGEIGDLTEVPPPLAQAFAGRQFVSDCFPDSEVDGFSLRIRNHWLNESTHLLEVITYAQFFEDENDPTGDDVCQDMVYIDRFRNGFSVSGVSPSEADTVIVDFENLKNTLLPGADFWADDMNSQDPAFCENTNYQAGVEFEVTPANECWVAGNLSATVNRTANAIVGTKLYVGDFENLAPGFDYPTTTLRTGPSVQTEVLSCTVANGVGVRLYDDNAQLGPCSPLYCNANFVINDNGQCVPGEE